MRRLVLLFAVLGAACTSVKAPVAAPRPETDDIELVESVPLETDTVIGHADIADAKDVWPAMIDRATKTLDFEEFYASDVEPPATSALTATLDAIARAHARGVRIRFLTDSAMAPKYPTMLDRLRAIGADVRILDCKPRFGGVQHAKFFVVDGTDAFVGSQNFDWRALDHIQEIGVRLHGADYAGALGDLFATDWGLADPQTPSTFRVHDHAVPPGLFMSPAPWLPDDRAADLPHLVALLDGAKTRVDLQVLTYSTTMRDKSTFTTLDDALRRAAGRGVKVRILVSSWGVRSGAELASVQALAAVPNVEVRSFTIPPFSGGDIPFARVAHAKFLVVDDRTAWIGTSNWEGDYFLKTRNVAVVTALPKVVTPLRGVFATDWASRLAATVAPRAGTGPGSPGSLPR